MKRLIRYIEDSKDNRENESWPQPDILEFQWRLLSYDTNMTSIHLKCFHEKVEMKSEEIKQSSCSEQSPASQIFWDIKGLIEGCDIGKIREQIFSSFRNSNNELFKILPENINNMGEYDSSTNRTLGIIGPSNRIDVRRKFEKFDNTKIELIIEDLESGGLSIAELSRKYSWSKSALYNIRKQKHYYLHGKAKRHFSKISSSEAVNLVKHINEYLNTHHILYM